MLRFVFVFLDAFIVT